MAPRWELPTGRASSQWLAGLEYHIRWDCALTAIQVTASNRVVKSLFFIVLFLDFVCNNLCQAAGTLGVRMNTVAQHLVAVASKERVEVDDLQAVHVDLKAGMGVQR